MTEKSQSQKQSLTSSPMDTLSLGKSVEYKEQYDPSLLQPVPRQINRTHIGLSADNLPFHGTDQWNGYELSWLNAKGKPKIAILQCSVPATSPNLIESKSFKLYLNSFNQTRFNHSEQVETIIRADLSQCAGDSVEINLVFPSAFDRLSVHQMSGVCIDELDICIDEYTYDASHLKTSDHIVSETLVSHLLKSNCLITNQPDWGSVLIRYSGKQIDHASLLRYLISFRNHNEFHEQCVERIFNDIRSVCAVDRLTVYARYTRRGGLDINPFRSNFEEPYANLRLARQ